ncbi:alpha-2-macroglobulin [Undibacterium jejuense]|uniref:Alpha-2-macroglobulin n=1 Tax=Undibacterium jejuense TaxID=1344949 RepID=A0A923HPA6_9BURK|nr:MG2 domain-containing protein [Undibacterium jejuense]MBC3862268.1 alpha-2-macroglobulin [Undibacterium jejuense]
MKSALKTTLRLFGFIVAISTSYTSNEAKAANVVQFSPQGEIAQVRQVKARFSEAAVVFGDPKAAAPFDIKCSATGSGRWADEKTWVYDFTQDLAPGEQCSFSLKPDYKTPSGAALTGKSSFQFSTGGPSVTQVMPYSPGEIEEDQAFMFFQNAAVNQATLVQHVYCEIEGIHERVPVHLINGEARNALIKHFAQNFDQSKVSTLQCQQKFPPKAAVKIVFEKGVTTLNGVPNQHVQSFSFKTRDVFTARMSCERENANAACTPILPVRLFFTAPISRKQAEKIVLKSNNGSVKPELGHDEKAEWISDISFKPPFAEKTELTISLPSGIADESGRTLSNAAQFPLKFVTAAYPPLAKFPAAPFGIVELNADATLPVTLRNVENSMLIRSADGKRVPAQLANLRVSEDGAIIEWLSKLNLYHETTVEEGGKAIETRSIGLLEHEPNAQKVNLPPSSDSLVRPFEVIGIPFKAPGFYVLELESQKLGASLLGKPVPMYVRTSALVTNLAVHIKLGRENGAVWVTRLDNAKPVADAEIHVSDCMGKPVWSGKTNAIGIANLPGDLKGVCTGYGYERNGRTKINGYFVSARKTDEKGRADMAFALSSWNAGIESYRFNLPMDYNQQATIRAHTVLDRSLFRAGETVSMKHLIRLETMHGLAMVKPNQLPTRLRIIHQGSNQEFQYPLTWRGQIAAESTFAIPQQAKLGRYEIVLDSGKAKKTSSDANDVNNGNGNDVNENDRYGEHTYYTSSFRVEEFRLPLLQGRITPPKGAQITPKELPVSVQLNYLNGGGASGLPVQITSMMRNRQLSFPNYDQFSFYINDNDDDDQKIVANKIPVTLDKAGSGKTIISNLPAVTRSKELVTEMSFADPNGEIQTVSNVTPLWPAAVVVGIKSERWVSVKDKTSFTLVSLDTDGKPLADVPLSVSAVAKNTNSHRKRLVGGFYAYENEELNQDLGQVCSGKSDARGLLICEIDIKVSGNIELTARATDRSGKSALAKSSFWSTGRGEIWFDGENQDRMDVLPEKKQYQAGETASFQIRMPFRSATALVSIEREGVIDTMVMELNGRDPTVRVPIKSFYGPNVFVSVLAVRGRMREVPWYSFFTWGWREPINWWTEFREYQAPTATVDLAKPAYKLGIAEISVGTAGNQLAVKVSADKTNYPIRGTAKVDIQVNLPDGKPAAGAEIAVAAVDEALLELQPNETWNVLPVLLQRRSYGIDTATAQMQVIGKRHYGRKAVAAGGGGGKSPTRELLDTLLLWKPVVMLDANGRAQIEVPLNDALSSFKIVAVAQSGASLFGTGSTSIRTAQDLQIVSGLPPLVREGDNYTAMFTLRNTSTRAMNIAVQLKTNGALNKLSDQQVHIPAGESRELNIAVQVPNLNGDLPSQQLQWEIQAQETGNVNGTVAKDGLKLSQKLIPAIPVTVQQANLLQLDKTYALAVNQPAESLPGRGGIKVSLVSSLLNGSDGIRRYFETYPYSCLEQKTSRAIGLRDPAMWKTIVTELPTYLDADGLAYYYPPSSGGGNYGSDTLTAYILAATQDAGYAIPDTVREKMLQGLTAFVEGKITRDFWSPRKDLDVRKLAALEALSRYHLVQPRMLGSIQVNPNLWPTNAVLDWYSVLTRTQGLPQRDSALKEADQILRSRLNYQGTRMGFSTERDDYWWWLMGNGDVDANRLLLVMLDNPQWRDDLPKILNGSIQRQVRGHWMTTTANVWGMLALEKFAAKFESEKVSGISKAALQTPTGSAIAEQTYTWTPPGSSSLMLPWSDKSTNPLTLKLTHDGKGKPWVSLQSLAAVPLTKAFSSGYRISKTITPVEQKVSGSYSRGDILRINVDIDAQTDMSWVVVTDPIPTGASLLGSGLGRDSLIATSSERKNDGAWVAYEERSFEAFRSYYQFVPKGKFSMSYTMRLNNPGEFHLPSTRVEAMYAPEMFGEAPNAKITVK